MNRGIFLLLLLYGIAVLETSVFVHIPFLGTFPFVMIGTVLMLGFLEPPSSSFGVGAAFLGGLFLDAFSQNFFGFWVAVLLLLVSIEKFVFKKYVRFSLLQRIS